MSQENVEFVRGLLAGFMGTDLVPIFADEAQTRALADAFEPMLHPEFEFLGSAGGMAALDGEYRGRKVALDAFVSVWSEALTAWETFVAELEEVRELPDGRILLLSRSHGRSKAAGVEIEGEHGSIYTVRDGKLLRLERPEIVFESFMPDSSEPVVVHGPEAVDAHLREALAQLREFRLVGEEFREVGSKVFVAGSQAAIGRQSGVTVEAPIFSIWTFRGGKVVRLIFDPDRAKALEAAGLSE